MAALDNESAGTPPSPTRKNNPRSGPAMEPSRRAGTASARAQAWSIALLVSLSACLDSPTIPEIREAVFAEELDIDIATFTETEEGLFYKDLVVGAGAEATATSQVEVAVTGWLPDGRMFQSQVELDPFTPGDGAYILGVELGVIGMHVGGTRIIILPHTLAFGRTATGIIPAYSIVLFEMNLLEVN